MEVTDYERIDANDDHEFFETHVGEETYLRVLSESEVEIIFERDGEVVVQRFEVIGRDTVVTQ